LSSSTAVFPRSQTQTDGSYQASPQGQEERSSSRETRGLSRGCHVIALLGGLNDDGLLACIPLRMGVLQLLLKMKTEQSKIDLEFSILAVIIWSLGRNFMKLSKCREVDVRIWVWKNFLGLHPHCTVWEPGLIKKS